MAELASIIMNNPYIGQFLASLSSSFGTEIGGRVAGWICGSLEDRLKRNKVPPKDIEKAQRYFARFSKNKDANEFLASVFWMDFLTFMFPETTVDGNSLTEQDCDYIIARTYAASELQSLLCSMNYNPRQISYMAQIKGKSKSVYSFDLKAWYNQEYFDNLLIGRVIDNRIGVPTEYVNSLPMLVQDINGDTAESPASIRDHDILVLIHTGKIEKPESIKNTIKTVQNTYDTFLPRILYLTEEDLEELVGMERKKATVQLTSRIKEMRPYRG